MAADIQELHENAQQGAGDRRLAPVTVSMAILAVLGAIVSLLGGRIHADEVLAQTRETDQWAEFQAKVIRERSYEVFLDELNVFTLQNSANVQAIKTKYASQIAQYTGEMNDLQKQATATESQVNSLERRSNWFDFSEVLLESSVVICSITLLTQKRFYWYAGLLLGGSGSAIAAVGLLLH